LTGRVWLGVSPLDMKKKQKKDDILDIHVIVALKMSEVGIWWGGGALSLSH
jgi:hypothetical protein